MRAKHPPVRAEPQKIPKSQGSLEGAEQSWRSATSGRSWSHRSRLGCAQERDLRHGTPNPERTRQAWRRPSVVDRGGKKTQWEERQSVLQMVLGETASYVRAEE